MSEIQPASDPQPKDKCGPIVFVSTAFHGHTTDMNVHPTRRAASNFAGTATPFAPSALSVIDNGDTAPKRQKEYPLGGMDFHCA